MDANDLKAVLDFIVRIFNEQGKPSERAQVLLDASREGKAPTNIEDDDWLKFLRDEPERLKGLSSAQYDIYADLFATDFVGEAAINRLMAGSQFLSDFRLKAETFESLIENTHRVMKALEPRYARDEWAELSRDGEIRLQAHYVAEASDMNVGKMAEYANRLNKQLKLVYFAAGVSFDSPQLRRIELGSFEFDVAVLNGFVSYVLHIVISAVLSLLKSEAEQDAALARVEALGLDTGELEIRVKNKREEQFDNAVLSVTEDFSLRSKQELTPEQINAFSSLVRGVQDDYREGHRLKLLGNRVHDELLRDTRILEDERERTSKGRLTSTQLLLPGDDEDRLDEVEGDDSE